LAEELVRELKAGRGVFVDGLVLALGYLREPTALEAVTQTLKTSDSREARLAAAVALGELKSRGEPVVQALLDAVLDDADERLRVAAAASLAELKEPRAVKHIIAMCRRLTPAGGVDPNHPPAPRGRDHLLLQLGRFRYRQTVEFLLTQVNDGHPAIRKAAGEALKTVLNEEAAEGAWREMWENLKNRPDWIRADLPGEGPKPDAPKPPASVAPPPPMTP
jgi:HEAT repeat protein